MAIKKWKVTAQVDFEASKYDSVVVEANTERKAYIKGEQELRKSHHYLSINIVKVEVIV